MKVLSNQKGFTMIELIVVIIILGILAAIAVPKYFSMQDSAEIAACRANMKSIESAIMMNYAEGMVDGSYTALGDAVTAYNANSDDFFSTGVTPTCPQGGDYVVAVDANDNITITCPNGHTLY